jgi:stage II sporulation protein D
MNKRAAVLVILCVLSALPAVSALGCSGAFLAPNPSAGISEEASEKAEKQPHTDRKVGTGEFDFSKAFDDGEDPRDASAGVQGAAAPAQAVYSLRYPPVKLQKRLVRVMVRQGVNDAAVYSSATAHLRTGKMNTTFKGRMHVEALYGGVSAIATAGRARTELPLPCTLYVSSSGANLLELGESSYRGALVVKPEEGGGISFINILDMEDYLRGVVPLEIGNLKNQDIEAVKAQAVAARTYAYRRMAQREAAAFDLAHTVSDQVYGGANAEAPVSDMAVRLTKDLVMVYEDGLISAYYHSTCGGRTANIEDVWGGEAYPYLRSVSDAAPGGNAYCGGSSSFSWTESWNVGRLTSIIRRYSAEGNLNPPFGAGALRAVEVKERFECGRVKTLSVVSSVGEHVTGGDKARFLLRRDVRMNQILRSAKFNSARISGGEAVITGGGYGHGIGMCQVGAIGRARAGQDFERILRAYYSGISIRSVAPE